MTSAEIRQSFLDFFREKQHSIVPSASLLPDAPNLLFTNAGMNQFVPIFLGNQTPPWNPPRVADTQKCIRAGGKHNDLDDVGLDTYHHTFFEMLGNWSFGDYFKKEAIEWAWELVIARWKLPAPRLYATVYQPGPGEPSEFDQEAHDHWARLFKKAGLDPAVHVVDGNKKDNFWMMGDTGPCGPCSELHIDLTPMGDTKGSLVNAGDPRCIEIWNLVFIQFNAGADGTFSPLPQRHVDTGMGFERVTAMIQGTKGFTDFSRPISNYETDVFRPIFDELEKLSGTKYRSTLPGAQVSQREDARATDEQEKVDVAFRVIADHIRTLTFAIADGIQPGNTDRNYVLRRILRRAVRYGRTLGFHQPFFYQLVAVVVRAMADVFPEIGTKQRQIEETVKREEEAFNKTLDHGISLFEGAMTLRDQPGRTRAVPGDLAFTLYDTYGFPLDLTELMARERGLTVDVARFEKLMGEQRARGRAAQKKEVVTVSDENLQAASTSFLGYDFVETEAVAELVLPGAAPNEFNIVLNRTPCYAEMGGQVGDHGFLHVPGPDRTELGRLQIADTQKRGQVFIHRAVLNHGRAPEPGEAVQVSIDLERRRAIQGHHTVTHLLHWALHENVSRDASQKGSYVGPEKLTFDFTSAPLTKEQVRKLNQVVNEKITESSPVSWKEIPYHEAKQRKDIIQFFGEKYGDTVRVVQIGGESEKLNGYSMELCGGTHVRSTSEIGSFRIVREEAIAAGIRRIEAVAGEAAGDWAKQECERQQKKFEMLARKKSGIAALPIFDANAEPTAMLTQVEARSAHLEKLEAEVHDWEKQQAKASEGELRTRAGMIANELVAVQAEQKSCVAEVNDGDAKLLQAVVDSLRSRIDGPIFLLGKRDGRVSLIASVPKSLISRVQANKLIQEIAPIVGGKGGGRPETAQGAGNDVNKVGDALARARELVAM